MEVSSNDIPQVSVIVPVYNVAPYIEECAESLFKQTLSNIEYIFIDDASTDNSLDLLKKIINKYPEREKFVKVIRHESNKGISFTRQEGVDLASGEWVIHCDSDDFLPYNAYETLLKEGRSDNYDIIIGSFNFFGKGIKGKLVKYENETLSNEELFNRLSGLKKNIIIGTLWNKLIKRELYNNIRFPDNVSYCEDVFVLFEILALKSNLRISITQDIIYNYRLRDNSLICNVNKKNSEDVSNLIKLLQELKSKSLVECENAFNSKIISLLFRLIKTNFPINELYLDYYQYRKFIKLNKEINFLEKLHLFFALNGHIKLAYFTKGIYKYMKNLKYFLIKI